jgi:hypothetical protein
MGDVTLLCPHSQVPLATWACHCVEVILEISGLHSSCSMASKHKPISSVGPQMQSQWFGSLNLLGGFISTKEYFFKGFSRIIWLYAIFTLCTGFKANLYRREDTATRKNFVSLITQIPILFFWLSFSSRISWRNLVKFQEVPQMMHLSPATMSILSCRMPWHSPLLELGWSYGEHGKLVPLSSLSITHNK